MRAFLAVGLPGEAREALAVLQQQLEAARADVKWVEPANLHLTLKFLAEITDAQRVQVEQLVRRIAGRLATFSMRLGALGAFPSMTAPRVVWVGCEEGREALARLAEAIEQDTAPLGLGSNNRPFAAHLTIGRVRSPRGRQQLTRAIQSAAWIPPAAWQATAITLYQSVLSRSGPAYSVLAEMPLMRRDDDV